MLSSMVLYGLALLAVVVIIALMFYKEGWHQGHKAGWDARKRYEHGANYGMGRNR